MGLEPMTSPLPRECSTTELHQPVLLRSKLLPTTLYFNATASVSTRCGTRKTPAATKSTAGTCPAPSCATPALPAVPEQPAQRSTVRYPKEPCPYSRLRPSKNGAQGRIRTFVATSAADLQSAAINHSATCAHPACLPVAQSSTSDATEHRDLHGSLPALHLYWRTLQAGTTSRYNQTFLMPPGVKTGAGEGI